MDLKQRLKSLREQRGWSQGKVADLMGIDRAQYSRVENEKVEPNLSTLKKIALAFDIQLANLFDEDDSDVSMGDGHGTSGMAGLGTENTQKTCRILAAEKKRW